MAGSPLWITLWTDRGNLVAAGAARIWKMPPVNSKTPLPGLGCVSSDVGAAALFRNRVFWQPRSNAPQHQAIRPAGVAERCDRGVCRTTLPFRQRRLAPCWKPLKNSMTRIYASDQMAGIAGVPASVR
jgi:hypothetical protein